MTITQELPTWQEDVIINRTDQVIYSVHTDGVEGWAMRYPNGRPDPKYPTMLIRKGAAQWGAMGQPASTLPIVNNKLEAAYQRLIGISQASA